jgi:hypothetical protein
MFDVFYIKKPTGLFAHEKSCDSIQHAQSLSRTRYFWIVDYLCDYSRFDWLWEPPPWQSHQRHAWPSQWQQDSGTYLVPRSGYTDTNYHTGPTITRTADLQNWYVPDWIDPDSIDFSWHPDVLSPASNYHFSVCWGWNRVGGPEYRMPDTNQWCYLDSMHIRTLPAMDCWYVPDWIDPDSIDFSWRPDPTAPPYVYEFPTEWNWNNIGGPEFRVPGAVEKKYLDVFVARTRADPANWQILDHVAPDDSVLRWRPHPAEPAYTYVFGNQWWPAERRESARYQVPGANKIKYVDDVRVTRLPSVVNYSVLTECDWDYSWEPDPGDPPYIYVFGNQWHSAEIMPTVEYHVPGATERKFMSQPLATLPESSQHWIMLYDCDWDYSWQPDPGDPPYIYVFGNQWHSAEIMPTVEYHVPGATERKFMSHPRAVLCPDRTFWHTPEDVDPEKIDYSWRPDPGSPPYVYHFGTQHQSSVGVTYTVPGATEIKFAGDIPVISSINTVMINFDIFYLDHSNPLSQTRFQALRERYPDCQRVRYVNSLVDTVKRCAAKSRTSSFWILSSSNDYTDFDLSWHPQVWQRGMIHVFGTQWSKWSDTFLISRVEFERQVQWNTDLQNFYNLNFVTDQQVKASTDAVDIILIDHGNQEKTQCLADLSRRNGRVIREARYFESYLDTFRRVINDDITAQHVWVASTLCDYAKFDFSWQPEIWQRDMIHVFASDDNKFGDTFLIPVDAWRKQQQKLELLDWFDTVNYVSDITVPRWPMPVLTHDRDSHMDVIHEAEFSGPLLLITCRERDSYMVPAVSIWSEHTKTVVPLDPGGETVVIPRAAIAVVREQFYDYRYIDKAHRNRYTNDPLDIVFISNGEHGVEHHWKILNEAVSKQPNRIHRVDGIKGRVAAYQAAAQASTTPWFFAVFAKLQVNEDFDWSWQPDRMQEAKHYIFHAYNPVNHLIYGHQAMIAYNCKLVMANSGQGLDFTLDDPHEVVPIMSGTAYYDNDAWTCWRTAFREAIKLRHSVPDVENEYRLGQWLQENNENDYVKWSHIGAQDAMEYYDSVGGDFRELKKSYDWDWLSTYAMIKHPTLIIQR